MPLSDVEPGRLDLEQEFETSSMLLAPTLEQHETAYARLFDPADSVLDVGAGDFSFVRKLKSLGIKAEGFSPRVPGPAGFEYDVLNFSESVGYLTLQEFRALITPRVRKVILKDFYVLPGESTRGEETNYDFGFLRDKAFPVLLSSHFRVEMAEFYPFKDRWIGLLQKHGVKYQHYPHFRTVVMRAVREQLSMI